LQSSPPANVTEILSSLSLPIAADEQERYLKAAVQCANLASITTDQAAKEVLLVRALDWLRLAADRGDTDDKTRSELERVAASMWQQHRSVPRSKTSVVIPFP